MKLVWCSDVHLNFLNVRLRHEFYASLKGDAILISGDIAESHSVVGMVEEMEKATKLPVYFVLGNHDFYGSDAKTVKERVKHLGWLPQAPMELSKDTLLIGVDGWGDCRAGDFENSHMVMNDWVYIDDLLKAYGKGMPSLKEALQKLADKDARALKKNVLKALKQGYKKLILVSHVPPFEEASWHAGRKSTPSGLPFYTSQILGDTILPIAKKNPGVDFLWLSGHTHSRASYEPLPNMKVKVAKSEYYFPRVERVINI